MDDKKFKLIIHNTKFLNLNLIEIKVLYCIYNPVAIIQRDIKRQADIRLTEMRHAIKIVSMGILDIATIQNPIKGRPHKCYNLKKPVSE
nr:hypothetical protein [uncultured Methanoregula sp.]